ncbi:MAG: hypothetical protein LBI31_00965 [Zoogloeaceae bacterium]|jgi:hypothetical protein|nr:hypothetical protein [Zoogloeaceae bacterium]
MDLENKPTHGGARKGSGRKPGVKTATNPMQRVDVTLSTEVINLAYDMGNKNISRGLRRAVLHAAKCEKMREG